MTGKLVYHWKHGWIPLTRAAALSKAKGNKHAAQRYLASEHVPLERRNLRNLPDEHVSGLLQHAAAHGDNRGLDAVVKELDRRDRVTQTMKATLERKRREREVRNHARDSEYDRRVAAGHDPEAAYADVYGVSVHKQRTANAIASLRSNGHKGAGFHDLSRHAFAQELDRHYFAAEDATKGALLNNDGRARGVDPRQLFRGNEATARRYASEELKQWWDDHGRITLEDFRANLLGGSMRHRTSGEAFHQ